MAGVRNEVEVRDAMLGFEERQDQRVRLRSDEPVRSLKRTCMIVVGEMAMLSSRNHWQCSC